MRTVLIARSDASDNAAIEWAVRMAEPADEVHLFFPYRELAVHHCSRGPAVHAADAHRDQVRRVAHETLARARAQHGPVQFALGGSIVAADRADLLGDAGSCADNVVLGVPSCLPAATALDEARRVTATSVVLVPTDYQPATGTVVVADLTGVLGDRAVATAARIARPSGATVLVMRSYLGEVVDVDDLVKQTESLDEALLAWRARAGEADYAALAAEIVEEPMADALRRERGHLLSLVLPVLPDPVLDDLVAVALDGLRVPVVLTRDE
jgi:hypothetical protein